MVNGVVGLPSGRSGIYSAKFYNHQSFTDCNYSFNAYCDIHFFLFPFIHSEILNDKHLSATFAFALYTPLEIKAPRLNSLSVYGAGRLGENFHAEFLRAGSINIP